MRTILLFSFLAACGVESLPTVAKRYRCAYVDDSSRTSDERCLADSDAYANAWVNECADAHDPPTPAMPSWVCEVDCTWIRPELCLIDTDD